MIHQPDGLRGPLAVCGVEPDGTLGRIWEPAPHVGWSSWERFSFRAVSAPLLLQNADQRLELFATGGLGRLGHCWQARSGDMEEWSEWEDIGPPIQFDPTVCANADGRLEAFAAGPDGVLGHMWQLAPGGATGWSEWSTFGCELRSSPAAALSAHGSLEVFAMGADGCLGHVWQTRRAEGVTDWSAWSSFGWEIQSRPVVCRMASGLLEVFAIGSDGCLGHIWQQLDPDGGVSWWPWDSFGIEIQSPPAVSATKQGGLELFAIGPDGCLGHIWQHVEGDGHRRWSHWDSFDIAIQGEPAVAQDADGQLVVLANIGGGRLGLIRQWESDHEIGWGEWGDLGPAVSGRVAVCPWRPAFGAERSRAAVGAVPLAPPAPVAEPTPRPSNLSADFCVIGAGPAGITLCEALLSAGASVVLVESGDWHEDAEAQRLNHGDAEGPIIKGSLKYLRNGRRRQVQGSAVVWGGWCLPFRPLDFAGRDWVALSGWPLAPDELAPFELRAADTLGIDAFEAARLEGPLLRLSYHYPRDLLLFRSKLMALADHPELTLELGATAVGLERQGDRIESVRIARFAGGEARISARTVVLAAGGIENARILLHHRVLGDNPMLGRCFMDHPHVLAGTVRLPDPEPLRACLSGSATLDVLSLSDSAQRDERLLNATVQLMPLTHGSDRSDGGAECELFVRSEQAPNPDSRLVLGQRPDRFGWPQPELAWRLLDQDWTTVARTAELVALVLEKRYGARSQLSIRPEAPWPGLPADPSEARHPTWGNHHIGTTRMSRDPAEGVVDPDCRVHDLANLYLAGSSVFPTGGAANPTFTIVALTHRLADHLTASGGGSVGQQELRGQAADLRPVASGDPLGGVHAPDGGAAGIGRADQSLS